MASVSQNSLLKNIFLCFVLFFVMTLKSYAMYSPSRLFFTPPSLSFTPSHLLLGGRRTDQSVIHLMEGIRGPYIANMYYEYDDADINNLLLLRAQEAGLDLTRTVLMPPLDNTGDQIVRQLQEERVRYGEQVLAQEIAPTARTILAPINFNNIHWVGLVIRLDAYNQVLQVQYIDPLGSSMFEDSIPEEIRRSLSIAYGGRTYIENLMLLRQTDGAACGVLTVENLIRAAQGQMNTEIAYEELTREIRNRHIYLLEQFRPELQFNFRQENNISDWSKRKLFKLSFMSQFRDLKLNAIPDAPELLLSVFLRTAEKIASTQKRALNLLANPVFQQIMATHTSSTEVERLKVEFITRISELAHKKVEREEEGSGKEYLDVPVNDFIYLFITGLKCLCSANSTVVSEGKYILKFKKLLSHSVTKTPYHITHSLVIEFDNPENDDPLMFAFEMSKLLLKLSMGGHDQLNITPTPIFDAAERGERIVRVRYDISVLPPPKVIPVEKLWEGAVDFSPALEERLERMLFESNRIKFLEIPTRVRIPSQIRDRAPPLPFDERFPNYNANFVYENRDIHVAVGQGPESEESFVRLLRDLTSLYPVFSDNKKIIVALGNFYPGKDFIPYYDMSKVYLDKGRVYRVTTAPILGIKSSHISGYSLNINESQEFLVLNVRMPEDDILALDEVDLQLLYNHVYSENKAFVFFHCRVGMGRSASFATLMKLFKEWEYLFQDQFSRRVTSEGGNSGLSESDFVNRIQRAYWEVRLNRPICPAFDLFKQIFQILLKFRSIYVASF